MSAAKNRNRILVKSICACFFCLVMMSLASCDSGIDDKIHGSWYTERMQEVYFAEDGTYTLDLSFEEGGTYTVEEDRIILTDPLGGVITLIYNDEDGEPYLYEDDGSLVFYSYDEAYEIYCEKAAAATEEKMSTVEQLRDYFVGTWKSDGRNSLHDYVVKINDDGTFVIESDDAYYEDSSHAGLKGTWTFEEGWNDKMYVFTAHYPSAESDQTFSKEKNFYIPDWEQKDFSYISITIYDCKLYKQD